MGRVPLLDRYTRFVDQSQIESIYNVARSLAGLRVLHKGMTVTQWTTHLPTLHSTHTVPSALSDPSLLSSSMFSRL